MEENRRNKSRSISNEKLLLASIPVIGSIIIALVTSPTIKCNDKIQNTLAVAPNLKEKAGKVDDMVMYSDYDDLYPIFSEGLKPVITRELFKHVNDSIKIVLGNFIKPIDTTQSTLNGMDVYYVKNQHQNGQSLVSIAFDNHEKITHLFYIPVIQK